MAENEKGRTDWGPLIGFFRLLKRWNQTQLARLAGVDKAQISRYEAGDEVPRPSTFERIREAAGVPSSLVAFIQWFLQIVRESLTSGATGGATPVAPNGWSEDAQDAAGRAVERSIGLARAELVLLRSRPLGLSRPPAEDDLLRVDRLWQRLENRPDWSKRWLVENSQGFRDWLLCLRVCDESEKVAAADAQKALALAEFSLFLVRHLTGTSAWLSRLEGYCMAFLANARRVASNLPAAEAGFARCHTLWEKGEDPAGLLPEARVLDLKASLHRDCRRFAEAIELHRRALAVAKPDEAGSILLNKSATLEQKGDYEASIEALKQAAFAIDGQRQPRLLFGAHFNLAANLCRLGRTREAAALLPRVRELADQLDNHLDRIRTRWLEGNIDAGLGNQERAVAALEEVRYAFAERKLAYDYALASLDLALLYREQERFAEIGEIAREILTIFRAQEVHREALASILLFREGVEKQTANKEMMRRLQDYLGKARSNPQQRFEA